MISTIGNANPAILTMFTQAHCWCLAIEIVRMHGGAVLENGGHVIAEVDGWFIDITGIYESTDEMQIAALDAPYYLVDPMMYDGDWREADSTYEYFAEWNPEFPVIHKETLSIAKELALDLFAMLRTKNANTIEVRS